MSSATTASRGLPQAAKKPLRVRLNQQKSLLVLVVPAIVWLLVFRYWPIYGIVVAFKEYNVALGVARSPWIGLRYFEELFTDPLFYNALRNTFLISGLKLVVGFPFTIVFAILLNEVRNAMLFKKTVQTLSYLPYFVSWAFVSAFLITFLSDKGLMNAALMSFGVIDSPMTFLGRPNSFVTSIVLSDVWKTFGFSSIIYLAAITSVDQNLYEAAIIDGANRFQRIWHITLPAIKPTIVILLILAISRMVNQNFEQLYLLQNPLIMDVGRIIETFTYETGIKKARISYATAIGLFKSFVAFLLLLSANTLSRRITNESIF